VYFDRGHPCFRNFNSTIPVDIIRVKSYVNSFLDPMRVPVRISINKLELIPDRIMASLVGVFRNGRGLGMGESYIPVMFFDPLLHRSPCFPDVDFATLTGNPVHNTTLFSWVDGVLWLHQYDLSAFLANTLSPLAGKSNFTVKNSTDFTSTIASEEIQDHEIMVSFDVESLFTNIPIEGAVKPC